MRNRIAWLLVLMALSSVAFAADGAAVYRQKCSVCHGTTGQGKPPLGPALANATKTDQQIVAMLTKGGAAKAPHTKPMSGMTPDQAKAAAGFVKGLRVGRGLGSINGLGFAYGGK